LVGEREEEERRRKKGSGKGGGKLDAERGVGNAKSFKEEGGCRESLG